MNILDFIYDTKKQGYALLTALYAMEGYTFQNAGQAIQSLLSSTKNINTSIEKGAYSRAEWYVYKRTIYNKTVSLIDDKSIFFPQDAACALHDIATMLSGDLINESIQPHIIKSLLTQLHSQRQHARSDDLAKSLWAIAKLVEMGQLTDANMYNVADLIKVFYAQHQNASLKELTTSLWAIGILFAKTKYRFHLEGKLRELSQKLLSINENLPRIGQQQLLMSIYLLGLEEHTSAPLNKLEDTLRPVINRKLLKYPAVRDILSTESVGQVEQEVNIKGFFVDILVTRTDGSQLVIEIDGPHHLIKYQAAFDAFRDDILNYYNIEVRRISTNDRNKPTDTRMHILKPIATLDAHQFKIVSPKKPSHYNPISDNNKPTLNKAPLNRARMFTQHKKAEELNISQGRRLSDINCQI